MSFSLSHLAFVFCVCFFTSTGSAFRRSDLLSNSNPANEPSPKTGTQGVATKAPLVTLPTPPVARPAAEQRVIDFLKEQKKLWLAFETRHTAAAALERFLAKGLDKTATAGAINTTDIQTIIKRNPDIKETLVEIITTMTDPASVLQTFALPMNDGWFNGICAARDTHDFLALLGSISDKIDLEKTRIAGKEALFFSAKGASRATNNTLAAQVCKSFHTWMQDDIQAPRALAAFFQWFDDSTLNGHFAAPPIPDTQIKFLITNKETDGITLSSILATIKTKGLSGDSIKSIIGEKDDNKIDASEVKQGIKRLLARSFLKRNVFPLSDEDRSFLQKQFADKL